MSAYDNFVKDFPERCWKLFERLEPTAMFMEYEVTFMLCMAAAGLTYPFERLEKSHPSGDREKYSEAVTQYRKIRKQKFCEAFGENQKSWMCGVVEKVDIDPDNWPELNDAKSITDKSTESTLRHLRNALAHGNIFTRGERDGNIKKIKEIIFLSKEYVCVDGRDEWTGKYDFISVKNKDFSVFLKNWFSFVRELKMPEQPVAAYDDSLFDASVYGRIPPQLAAPNA